MQLPANPHSPPCRHPLHTRTRMRARARTECWLRLVRNRPSETMHGAAVACCAADKRRGGSLWLVFMESDAGAVATGTNHELGLHGRHGSAPPLASLVSSRLRLRLRLSSDAAAAASCMWRAAESGGSTAGARKQPSRRVQPALVLIHIF